MSWFKRVFVGLVAVMMIGGVAAAQSGAGEGDASVKIYDFPEHLVDGVRRLPAAALIVSEHRRVQFDRLMKLKKSFVPRILENPRRQLLR